MEYKYIKINPEKFILKYEGTEFRDMDEYIADMKNLIVELASQVRFRHDDEKTKSLYAELKKKIAWVVDSNQVDPTVVGPRRGALMQLRILIKSLEGKEDLKKICLTIENFYNTRLIDQNSIVGLNIHSFKKAR